MPELILSRCPKQNFSVQIKVTTNYSEKDGIVKYCLKSLWNKVRHHNEFIIEKSEEIAFTIDEDIIRQKLSMVLK